MNVPKLRFNEFIMQEWEPYQLDKLLVKVSDPVKVEFNKLYREIGIRSHGKGIFHKDHIFGSELGSKRVFWVKPDALVLNIVFAWEQAVAVTAETENGFIASHRFPMFLPRNNLCSTQFLKYLFLTKRGKTYLELASPGGAGRNKTLGQKNFEELKVIIPKIDEQTKIAKLLRAVDEKITQLTQKSDLLTQYKNGVMQKIFSQELRFKDNDGQEFPEWECRKLSGFITENKMRNSNNQVQEVFSVAKNKGVINQIEHLGRSFASNVLTNYKVVFPNDVIYTKSPTTDFPYGIIKQNKLNRTGLVSVLYSVFKPINQNVGTLLDYYFSNWKNTFNYLNPIVKKGAKNTINISNDDFLNGSELSLPLSDIEQAKITNFLTAIDDKITQTQAELDAVKQFKQGLLQQMFV
jgi:type I restriction enzyme S subunit